MKISSLTLLPLFSFLSSFASAFEPLHTPDEKEIATFANIWKFATLYKDDNNPLLEELKFSGCYHGQYYWLESDQGDAADWEDRRAELGIDAKFFQKTLELRLKVRSNDGFDEIYERLHDAYIKWTPNESISFKLGKTKPQIGYYDYLQSSDSQPTFDSSQVFNQLRVDRATAFIIEGKVNSFTWQTGIYANDTNREFGQFGGAASFGAGIGYNAKAAFGWDRADFRFDWLHSDHDKDDTLLNRYDDIFSATFWGQNDQWGLVVEGFHASGGEEPNGDVTGIFIQPSYDIIPKRLQLLLRYSYTTGDGPASVRRQTRYESFAPDILRGQGDEYHALYAGGQYFIYGDKLKFTFGAEYAKLNGTGYEGITYLSGIRLSF